VDLIRSNAMSTPDQLLAQAQASLAMAQVNLSIVQGSVQQSLQQGQSGCAPDWGAALLQDVSKWACMAASYAVQAARGYAGRCAAAAQAARGAAQCNSAAVQMYCTSGPGGMLPAGQPWGVSWNGMQNCTDQNCVYKVADQVSAAASAVAAAQTAKTVACPAPMPVRMPPLRPLPLHR
jgi:hypothetical protein